MNWGWAVTWSLLACAACAGMSGRLDVGLMAMTCCIYAYLSGKTAR